MATTKGTRSCDREAPSVFKCEAQSAGQEESLKQEENTTFTDQRITIQDQGYVRAQQVENMQQYSMPEEEWHVRNIMSKPIPFYTGLWNTGDTLGKKLAEWKIPGDTLLGPHYNLVSTFTFFRGHPIVRFQLNGTKFHAGRLIVAFIPYYQFENYEDKLFTVSNLTAVPHVILDAGIANSGVLELPFVHVNTYFNSVTDQHPWQSLGTLVCCVYNRLRAAESSSQSIGLTAWISFDKCELHQPCYAHEVKFPRFNKVKYAEAESLVEGLLKSAVPLVKDMITPGMPMIGNVTGSSADLDKPTDPIEISRWVPNTVSGMTRGDGLDKSDRLCLTTGGYTIPDADLISTTKDDMNLMELCKIPTRVDFFDWNSTQTAGTRILHLPVCPNLAERMENNSDVVPPVTVVNPTLLGYIARSFKYWRGGLRYKIQLIASQMHTGRLMVSFGAGLEIEKADFNKASYLNTYVIDLQEKHEVEFVVPYMAERPWLRCDRCRNKEATGTGMDADPQFSEQTGFLDLYVLNPLARPESVSSVISVNVLISAADDFELAFPCDLAGFQGIGHPIFTGFTKGAEAESLDTQIPVSTREDEGVVTLGRGTGRLAPAGPTTMGENGMNLKTLLRRYTKVYHNRAPVGDTFRLVAFDNTPVLSGVNKCFNKRQGRQYRTTLAHFSELFTFWRGSLRYKLVFKIAANSQRDLITPGLTLRVYHLPGVFEYGTFTPEETTAERFPVLDAFEAGGVQVAVTDLQGSMEFEIPFYTPYTQLKTMHSGVPNARSATGKVYILIEAPEDISGISLSFDLYQAAGDDFVLNYLRTAPRIQFVADTDQYRDVRDNAEWIFTQAKTMCASTTRTTLPSIEEVKEDPSNDEVAEAEGLMDYVPGVSQMKRSTAAFDESVGKLTNVCDTANHLLLKASKKLGLTEKEEKDEEEGLTTVLEDASLAANTLMAPLQPMLETLLQSLKMLPSSLTKFLNTEMTVTEIVVELSNMITGVTAFVHSPTMIQKACAVVTIVSTLVKDMTTIIRNKLLGFALNVLSLINKQSNGCDEGNVQPESQGLSLDLIAPLAASAVVGLGIVGFKRIPSDKETMDFCKGMSEKLRLFNFATLASSNVRKMWNEIKELMQFGVDYILGLFQPQLLAQLKLEREFEQVEEWTQFIDSLDNIAYTDRIHYDYEFKNKVYKAIDQGRKYNSLVLQGKIGRAASIIREYVKKAMEIGQKCENSKNELPYRMDPYCVCLFGESNIGKSGCVTTLGYDIMDALNYPLHNRWCAINCSESFFSENYRQQSAVYFDDFSTFTSEEQYNKFMNLKANTALPLNMAFRKGEYFNSDFIFMTTNTPYPDPNFVTNHTALLRRRDKLVEAAWIEDEEIRQALRAGENMSRFRRLDNSHLRFRVVSSVDPTAAPGRWMTYAELSTLLIAEAGEHLQNQKRKVTNDLTRAGYILPDAQTGERRILSVEACNNSPSLNVLEPMLWKNLEWIEAEERFELFVDEAHEDHEYLMEQWKDAQDFFEAMGMDIQHTLKLHSYLERPVPVTRKIQSKLTELKEYLSKAVNQILEDHPWLAYAAKWSVIFAGVLAAGSFLFNVGGKIVHKCACAAIRYFGFRCGLCGKWPKLENVAPARQQWMLNEWSELYGNEDYKDEHITPLHEEKALRMLCHGNEGSDAFELGTKASAEGIYSDDTKGMRVIKTMAQNSPYSQDVKGMKVIRTTAQSRSVRRKMRARDEAQSQVETTITHRVIPYIYRVRTVGSVGVPSNSLNGFAIGDRKMLLNSHLFTGMKDGDYFECYHNGAWITIEYRQKDSVKLPNKDLVIYEMPAQFHAHKSNVTHFISEKDLAYTTVCDGSLVKMDPLMQPTIVSNLRIKALKELNYRQTRPDNIEYFHVQDGWQYRSCTAKGHCGSPLVCTAGKAAGKILGIHSAGDTERSLAQLVTKEMLERFVQRKLGTPCPEAEAKFGGLIPPGHFGRIGKAMPGKAIFPSGKTDIIKTEIHGMITKPETFPSVQKPSDPRLLKKVNPMRQAIEKYSFVGKPFPIEHRRIVNEMMRDEVSLFDIQRTPRILSWSEAVNGIPELEGFDRLPLSTSPGYPWILTRPKGESGKAYLFDEETGMPCDELMQVLEQRATMAKLGERVESVWVDCLKDERRPLEKILKGSTRLFTMPPVDFSILMRKYTLDFSCAVKNSRSFMDCKVGIDCQSLEWTELYKYLSEFSPLCVAGDFTRFDGSMPADLIMDAMEDINAFYDHYEACSEEDRKVRAVIFDELIHTIHLAKDEFYMSHQGNKSGNPITVILNSRINKRYMALAWLGLAERMDKRDMFSMAKFQENVRLATYGDDNILAIKPSVIDWYNQETISEYLEEFKIIYTNEEKTGVTKFKKLDECTFLKQGFRDHESIAMIKVPHMARRTITELLNWTRVAPDQDELLRSNCNDALRFMYFYGQEEFQNLRAKIQQALKEVDKRIGLYTYTDFHLWFLNTINLGSFHKNEIIENDNILG